MTKKIIVSVIVPTYHDWSRLKLCVNALKQQSYPDDFYEVIIVNNDPDEKPVDLLLPANFKIINEATPGSYAARNAALAVVKGDIVAFTDSDCIPDVDWIKNAMLRIESGVERVAGRVELFFKSEKLTLTEIYEKSYAFDQEAYAKSGVSVTANMFCWRKHFDRVGWFNESLMSGGDTEWGLRAKCLGIGIEYAPEVVVKHPARYSLVAMLQKRRRVAAGAENMDRAETNQSFLMLIFYGYLPPVRAFLKSWRKSELTTKEKLLAMALVYFFKVYSTTYKLGLKLGINHPERI